jgi:hypothetical protein
MKKKSVTIAARAAATTLALTFVMWSQPLYDRIHANIPYPVVLGDKILQPGDYTIQQLPDSGGGARVLLFYTDNGMKFETSAMTIPALDINTAPETKLVLNHTGDEYYINKIWVQGKDYGYELPIPDRLKSREKEKMTQATVAATYQPSSNTTAATTTTEKTAPAATTPDQQATAAPPPPVTSQTEAARPPAEQSQTPPAEPQPATTPTEPTVSTQPAGSANRDMDQAAAATPAPSTTPTEMPHTAANWLAMLLSGGALSGAGLMLRRKSLSRS